MFKTKNKFIAGGAFVLLFGVSGAVNHFWPENPFSTVLEKVKTELTTTLSAGE